MFLYILLLSLTLSSGLRVGLSRLEDPLSAQGHQLRTDYVESLEQTTECTFDEIDTIKVSVIQAAPPNALRSLHTEMLMEREDGSRTNPPQYYMEPGDNGNIKLTVEFKTRQLVNAYGCVTLPETDDYFGSMCNFSLRYIASDSGLELSEVEFSLVVRTPKHSSVQYVISAEKIYKKLCDCEINNDYTLEVEAYTDAECEIPLDGNTLIYGSLICLKVTTEDPLAARYFFNPTSVLMLYKDANGGDRTVEMRPLAVTNNGHGFTEIVMDVLTVGDYISYTITVVLEGRLRVLAEGNLRRLEELKEGDGVQGTSNWFTVKKEGGDSKAPTSFGSSLVGSVFALFVTAGLLLL